MKRRDGVVSFTPSRPALDLFVRARESVQRHLISCGCATSTFSESHGRVRSWLPEAPSAFLRSRSFLEREHQPRDHHWEKPKTQLRLDGLGDRDIQTYTRFPLSRGGKSSEQTKETRPGITYLAGSSWMLGYESLSEP